MVSDCTFTCFLLATWEGLSEVCERKYIGTLFYFVIVP